MGVEWDEAGGDTPIGRTRSSAPVLKAQCPGSGRVWGVSGRSAIRVGDVKIWNFHPTLHFDFVDFSATAKFTGKLFRRLGCSGRLWCDHNGRRSSNRIPGRSVPFDRIISLTW
ncbi:hypothetical protein SKAU_G00073880 [Synaphobranchus kaupii]|uniref:Uncharacterized protein n=1 Tax=Synaphobranchus kaupii TaxID=118154 RepID=A0A9Q1G794_SYNKA|nr:hypothetical protein SKAU_G00073880 [Synaphobranchus kaupii]